MTRPARRPLDAGTTGQAVYRPDRPAREAPAAMGPCVDAGRLARALALEVAPLGPDPYRVTGGAGAHVVLTARPPWTCDCPDASTRPGTRCKHVLAVYLHRQLAEPVRATLRELGQDRHPVLDVVCTGSAAVARGRPGAACAECGDERLTLAGGGGAP